MKGEHRNFYLLMLCFLNVEHENIEYLCVLLGFRIYCQLGLRLDYGITSERYGGLGLDYYGSGFCKPVLARGILRLIGGTRPN